MQCESKSASLPFELWEGKKSSSNKKKYNKKMLQVVRFVDCDGLHQDQHEHQQQHHQKIKVRLTGGEEAPQKIGNVTASLDLVFVKINNKFEEILSDFTNEHSVKQRITAIIQGKDVDAEPKQELIKQISKQLQNNYVKELDELSNRFHSKLTGLTQDKVKAREHFAKKMREFSNLQTKQDAVINEMLNQSDAKEPKQKCQPERKKLHIDRRQQTKVKLLEKTK